MFFTVLQKFYHKINLLSIDVSLGACSMAYLISTIFNTPLSFPAYLVLATSVWCIYTLDHLLDAKQLKKTAIAQRHVFHNKHYQTLLYSLILISIITFFAIILWIPLKMIIYGIIGGIFVLLHILLIILCCLGIPNKKPEIIPEYEGNLGFSLVGPSVRMPKEECLTQSGLLL